MLRRECDELRKVAFARPVGVTECVWKVVVRERVSGTGHQRARVGAEGLDERCDGVLRCFFSEGESLHVYLRERALPCTIFKRFARVEYLGEAVSRKVVKSRG